jgi:ketosteroid isomerase-like protein
MSQENVEVIRRGWNAWLRGDMRDLFETFASDIVWDTSHFRDWPEAAYHGTDGVQRFLSEWLEVWDEYEVTIEEVIPVPDGRVVSLMRHRGRGRASGVPMDLPMAQIATLRDSKVIRLDNYDDPSEALEAVELRNWQNA